jgi:predicted DsbA family dithiol-disulfide isomerase
LELLTHSHPAALPPLNVRWRSFELRPAGSPPLPPDYLAKIEAGRPRLAAVARESYGLTLNPGPFGIHSRPALVAEKFALSAGCGERFHGRLMHAYWAQALDISERAVLGGVADACGLDQAALLAALEDPLFDQQVQEDLDAARRYGLNSVPALVFAERYLVSGAQPVDVLRNVVEQIVRSV